MVGAPELQTRGSLQQALNTSRFFNTGKFHQNPAGIFQLLDVRLHHPKLVNTCLQNRVNVFNRSIDVTTNRVLDVVVRSVHAHAIGHVFRAKQADVAQFAIAAHGIDFLKKYIQVSALAAGHAGVGLAQSIQEHRILGVAGQSHQYVAHRHFQNDVHAATEVQPQVHLTPFDFFVGVFGDAQIVYRERSNGIQIRLFLHGVALGVFFGLAFNALRHKRKRELVQTSRCEGNGK